MSNVYLRNIETGVVKIVDTVEEEFAKLIHERIQGGRFPLWEQTGAHDADPEHHASAEEVASRSKWRVDHLSDVTADGVGQSTASAVEGSRKPAGAEKPKAEKPAVGKAAKE